MSDAGPPDWMRQVSGFDIAGARAAARRLDDLVDALSDRARLRATAIGRLTAEWKGPASAAFGRRVDALALSADEAERALRAGADALRARAREEEQREATRVDALMRWHADAMATGAATLPAPGIW